MVFFNNNCFAEEPNFCGEEKNIAFFFPWKIIGKQKMACFQFSFISFVRELFFFAYDTQTKLFPEIPSPLPTPCPPPCFFFFLLLALCCCGIVPKLLRTVFYDQAMSLREERYGKAGYEPTRCDKQSALFPGTFFLAEVCAAFYIRTRYQIVDNI